MLVDAEARASLQAQLAERAAIQRAKMDAVVPDHVKPSQTWKTLRAAESGLLKLKAKGEIAQDAELFEVPGTVKELTCTACLAHPVKAAHASRKTLKESAA
jgi:hypothetical protein